MIYAYVAYTRMANTYSVYHCWAGDEEGEKGEKREREGGKRKTMKKVE